MNRFEDRIAVVTGATSGIGRATALAFAAEGADVALCGRRSERLAEVTARVREHGRRVLELRGDVRDEQSGPAWRQALETEFGRVDCLVHAAGVLGPGSVFETSDAEWDRQLDSNVRAPFSLTRALAPLLRAGRDPAIVCVSSVT